MPSVVFSFDGIQLVFTSENAPFGFKSGQLQLALSSVASSSRLPDSPLKAAAIEAEYLTGRLPCGQALEQLRRLATDRSQDAIRLRAELAIALILVDECEFGTAQDQLQKTFNRAVELGEPRLQCEAGLRLAQVLSESSGPHAAMAVAGSLRRQIAETGDPHFFALLHIRLAVLEGRRGNLELALRNLKLAETLLEREPEFVIAGTLWLNTCAVHLYLGHYEEALKSALLVTEAASRSGHVRHAIAALGNEAFVLQQLGRLEEADAVLARIPDSVAQFPNHFFAILDNTSELRVLQGRLDEADALLEQATALAARSPGLRNSWQHLAAIESRVRLLHLRGQSDEAHRLALEAEQNAARRSEHLLRLSYQLLRASILLESGDVGEAALVLESLLLHSARLSQAQLVELDRILGDYFVRIGEAGLARDHLLRAARLNDRASSAIARTYLHRSLAAAGFAAPQDHVERQAEIRVGEPPLDFPSVKAAAQLLQTPGPPDMLGREVLSVLLRSGCVQRASMGDAPVDVPSDEPDSLERLVIPLGTFLERRYFIEAVPRTDIASLEMLLTIRALAAGAVEKHEARAREALKTALWRFESTASAGSPIVASPAMQQALAMIHQLAPSDVPVLLTGETGTGKEVFARELHRASGLKGAFVPFNCTAVARDMLDAQLFGHRRGAFTGATEDLPGVVRSARGGTLFLDEIGELDIELQPKLLRLLDRSEIHPLGEGQPIQVHVRLVAATNANLHEMVDRRAFRADLLYRLDVTRVNLPPLRERREEVPLLADHFLEVFARDARKARLTLSDEALEALLLHRWPGNVRQLASEMRRLVAFCKPGSVVRAADLSPDVTARPQDGRAAEPAAENVLPIALDQPIDDAVEQLERAMILAALAAEGGHVERAARRLGLSRKGLFLKRRRLRIE